MSSPSKSVSKIVDVSVRAFATRVAQPFAARPAVPTPFGGSVAAAVGALGAGLVSMAFQAKRGEGHDHEARSDDAGEAPGPIPGTFQRGRAQAADDLRDLLLDLVDRDAGACHGLRGAEAGDAEALLESFEVPAETAEACLAALRLMAAGRAQVPAALAADCAVAVETLTAGLRGALAVARENLGQLEGAETRAELSEALRTIDEEAAELSASLVTPVRREP